MNDQRLNLPSASAAHADSLCQGRHLCHSQFPSEDSEYSSYGNKVHAYMRGEQSQLTSDQLRWVQQAKSIEGFILDSWTDPKLLEEAGFNLYREVRLWAHDEAGSETNSGQADVYWIQGKRALLADYKSLFGDVPDVAENMQLRDLSVLIHLNYGVTEVTAYINQPRVTRNPKMVVYSLEDLKRAEIEMRERVKASMDPNSPRIPGEEQCKYCNGKLVCEEFKASAMTPLGIVRRVSSAMKPSEVRKVASDVVAMCSGETLADIRSKLKLTEMLQTAVNAEIRKRLTADGTSVPGLTLAEGNKVRSISDIMKAWELISGRTDKITPEQFSACCTIAIGKVEDAVKTALDCTAEESKSWINETLGPIITLKENAKSIERVKP